MNTKFLSLGLTGLTVASLATAAFAFPIAQEQTVEWRQGRATGIQSRAPIATTEAREGATALSPVQGYRNATPALVSGSAQEVGVYWHPYADTREIQAATKALRDAESSDERADARDKLAELLESQYDERLDRYQEHLDELEERLEEMRNQLGKRRDARREMVELRLKVIEAEADDLGWPSASSRMPSGFDFPTQTGRLGSSRSALPLETYRGRLEKSDDQPDKRQ